MNLGNCHVSINPATIRAKQLYRELRSRRLKNEKSEQLKSSRPDQMQCVKCTRRGNKQLYPTETMLHVSQKCMRKGKMRTYWRHYCESCAETYKPMNKRVGGKNY